MDSEYKKALLILAHNLRGPGGFDFRPISYDLALSMANFAVAVAEGDTCEIAHKKEAERRMANGQIY